MALIETHNPCDGMIYILECDGIQYADVTMCLDMSQNDTASLIGMDKTVFCRRWKIAYPTRRWPSRQLNAITNAIDLLLEKYGCKRGEGNRFHVNENSIHDKLILSYLKSLVQERQDLITPAFIPIGYKEK